MMENFPNLMRETVTQIQEAQRVPTRKPTLTHIIIKMAKFKERILKAAREKKEVTYKEAPIRLAADFSMKTLQATKECQEIFQAMKRKGLQPRLFYPAKLSIKKEGKMRSFLDNRRLKEYTSTKAPM